MVLKKLDSDTKKPLSDAMFKVTTAKGDVVGTGNGYYTTDARGEILIPNLPKGSYIITETKAPTGYILEQQTKTIDIEFGSAYTLEFFNRKMSSMQIIKLDAQTKQPLKDAEFKVYKMNSELLGVYKTDGEGLILFDKLEPGWYKIVETKAPEGYLIDDTPRDVEITGNQYEKIIFENQPMSSLVIKKFDVTTKQPLIGARFKITQKSGDILGEFTSDANGIIKIDNMAPGWYSATEITAPVGYKLYTGSQDFEIKNTKTVTLEFPNEKLTSLIIKKIDDKSGAPLIGAKFKVEKQNGEIVGTEYTTDRDGTINIPTLTPDWYIIREIQAPDGYLLDESPKTVQVKVEIPTVVTFTNKLKSGFQIIKIDANSGAPLPGAKFTVYKKSGEVIGEYTCDNNGVIILDNLENGWYKIAETKAPDGYIISESPKDVELTGNQFLRIVFENKKMTSLEILKIDAVSGAPLPGAKFTVEKQNGEKVYTGENGTIFTTDGQGIINIPTLEPDYYIVREVKAPVGYVMDEAPKTVQVKTDSPTVVTFANKKMTALQILKIDAVSGKVLPGAKFTVEKQNGEKIQTNENGTEFTTDGQGLINIPNLPPDYYIVREVKAPQGYVIDETPKTVQVKSDSPTIVTFENKPLSGLKIVKINSKTKAPIEGVEFEIAKMNGEKIPNGSNTYRFITDKTGQIYLSDLPDGYYVVTETKAADGYFLDAQPKTVEVKSGNPTVLEVENSPASGLLIVKTDARTGKPLQGVVFDVKKADGQRVQSSILDANQPNTQNNSPNKSTTANGDISGSYTTDSNGRIQINHLEPGEYHVVETKALNGYVLDTDVHSVTVISGKQAVLQLQNTPMAGLRIHKIDSLTKKGIYNVEFRVYDFETNKEVGGPYYSDNNGIVDFTGILPEGRYKILETRPAEGYLRDDVPKTIEFKAGKITEVTWENTAYMGQIQIVKKSADDNQLNGLPKGTPLSGATFEVYNYRTGNVVDQFTTGSDGRGASKILLLNEEIKAIPNNWSREQAIHAINLINSKIRGIINYYTNCTMVYVAMMKYDRILQMAAAKKLKRYYKGKWIPAYKTQNLVRVHQDYKMKIPSIKFRDIWIGVTSLVFCKWECAPYKKQEETPYTEEGRQIYFERTKKKRRNARLDELLSLKTSEVLATEPKHKFYNFEYYMNRAYALNRDKLKCRVCGKWLYYGIVHSHRINPNLPINKVNKVANLASMDDNCYRLINNANLPTDHLEAKTRRKVQEFRDKLVNSKSYVKANV